MTTARTQHTTNTVLGNGELYVDLFEDGAPTGAERYLGDSVAATISVTSERTTIQSGDGAVAQDLVDIVRSVSRSMGMTLRDSSLANWALFLIGETDSEAVAANEASTVIAGMKVDRWYQLGQSADNPSGPGEINEVVKGKVKIGASGAARAAISDEDYVKLEFDLKLARVRLTAAGSGSNVDFEFAYTPSAARTVKQAKATTQASQLTCALRYIEDDPAAGSGRNVYIRKCNLVPGGESALKSRDTEHQLAFTATVQDPGDGYPAIVIDGKEL